LSLQTSPAKKGVVEILPVFWCGFWGGKGGRKGKKKKNLFLLKRESFNKSREPSKLPTKKKKKRRGEKKGGPPSNFSQLINHGGDDKVPLFGHEAGGRKKKGGGGEKKKEENDLYPFLETGRPQKGGTPFFFPIRACSLKGGKGRGGEKKEQRRSGTSSS